jgi:hypothetical protein
MKREGRLSKSSDYGDWYESGDTNIATVMSRGQLLDGLRRIVSFIYEPSHYFDRALRGFQLLPRQRSYGARWRQFRRSANCYFGGGTTDSEGDKPSFRDTLRFFIDLYRGLPREFRKPLVRFLREVVRTCPEQLPQTLPFLCMGYHDFRYTAEYVIPKINEAYARLGLADQFGFRAADARRIAPRERETPYPPLALLGVPEVRAQE